MRESSSTQAKDTSKAMKTPDSPVITIDDALIEAVISRSQTSPRQRMVLPLHKRHDAPVHRMLNALQPASYIPPHRHLQPPKSETILVLRGGIMTLIFDGDGNITQVYHLTAQDSLTSQNSSNSPNSPIGIDIEPGIFHTFIASSADTVMLEIKPGPYEESTDKDFASWAPAENAPEAKAYLDALKEQACFLLKNGQ